MPRHLAGWAILLVVAVLPLGMFVASLSETQRVEAVAPLPDIAAGPAATQPRAAPTTPSAGSDGRHPVIIRHPSTLGVVDTELRDVRGTPIGVSCETCHAAGARPPIAQRDGAPETFHAGVELAHGSLSCASCHDPADRTRLRLADGTPVAMAEVMRLCGQCHGPQYRDYQRGSHGGMSGYWDLERGPRVRNSCVACHASHQPAVPSVMPAAPPRDRFLVPHPAPRPAARLPGRDPPGEARHD